ncbi:zf-DHHC-domain-containing protein [Durotheca rogersii]|uniref:zf-DHHC-domain-containing protein n=1 Tax=Durotheca rogersii TaxID=419775 RepID=UPI00221FCB13|nr:zf-DHHC-domain-containing protein [Durotheca rogersii]KAI5864923.1 zf-DHHC-domain-containing protein [Durotheca rogersii]
MDMASVVGSTVPALQRLAIPAVCVLIAFLAYTSQWLFATSPELAPGPLSPAESYTFNALVLCLWYTYYKACTVDPGRYVFPPGCGVRSKSQSKSKDSDAEGEDSDEITDNDDDDDDEDGDPLRPKRARLRPRRQRIRVRGGRWCRKCAAPKPPRAHHCRRCGRCIPKMDHHCPWTGNCVSLQTFPHFVRFLAYANLSLWALLRLLAARFLAVWRARHLPAYLGPTLGQLALLTVLALVAGAASFALGLLLATTARAWLTNTTAIEAWEVERHEAALERRAAYGDGGGDAASWWAAGERAPGGDRDAPHLRLDPVEFPYDVGFFANLAQAMGTRNPLAWLWPFAGGPVVAPGVPSPAAIDDDDDGGGGPPAIEITGGTGWAYDENGLNDREDMWPPADPDRRRNARLWRARRREADMALAADRSRGVAAWGDEREAFRWRQERDLARRRRRRHQLRGASPSPSEILGELEEREDYDDFAAGDEDEYEDEYDEEAGGSAAWTNADGETLADYGVDEDALDEDVPLAELLRRRKVRGTRDGEDVVV